MLVAHRRVETIVSLLASIEAGVPVRLLHDRLGDNERQALDVDTAPPSTTLAIIFTSGTTGRPKGVLLDRRAFEASAAAHDAHLGWRGDDRWLLDLPLAHVGGLSIVTRCLIARRTVVLSPRFDAHRFFDIVDTHRVTLASLVPTMLHRLVGRPPPPTLRAVLLGGAPASAELLARAREAGWPVHPTYGMTEACSQVATDGRPLLGVEIRLRDGAIELRGPMMFSGYLGQPPRDSREWFRTGDLGTLDESGQLTVHGRADDMIVTGGENVHPSQIEAWLLSQPGVHEAAVFGEPDDEWGQIVAAVIAADVPVETLDAAMSIQLAEHERVRKWRCVQTLPRTPLGKIDRTALRVI